MRKKNLNYSFITPVIMIVVVVALIIGGQFTFNFNDKEYTITVTDKERIVENSNGESSSKYLVFGENENGEVLVFENSDVLIRGKWNSSTIQGSLKEGNTYKVVVVGYRIPFLSCYENIISFEEQTN